MGEEIGVWMCVSSRACLNTHPGNTPTDFVYILPVPAINKSNHGLHIRVASIALPTILTDDDRLATSTFKLQISELELQQSGRGYSHTVYSFAFPPQDLLGAQGTYSHHVFPHAAYYPLSTQHLVALHVKITDLDDEVIDLLQDGHETTVFMELTNSPVDAVTGVTCRSKQKGLYDENSLRRFTTPLPQEINLDNHEVALLSVVYPANMVDLAEPATLRIHDVTLSFNLEHYETTLDFITGVNWALANCKYANEFRLRITPGNEWGMIPGTMSLIRYRVGLGAQQARRLEVEGNSQFDLACGQIGPRKPMVRMKPDDVTAWTGRPNVYLALPNPMALIKCDIVDHNGLSGKQDEMLQMVPLRINKGVRETRMYSPPKLCFQPVAKKPFNSITFSFHEPSTGKLKRLDTVGGDAEGMCVTVLIREKKRKNVNESAA